MKRIGGLFDSVCDVRTLTYAAWRASRGKRRTAEIQRFLEDLDDSVAEIAVRLSDGSFDFDRYAGFEIRDTKSRTIHAPSFRDRVVHHAVMAVVGPVFEGGATDRSCACRAGRGQSRALDLARRWVPHAEAFLKLDVAKYYDSVPHAGLRIVLRRRLREEHLLHLFDRLLASYEAAPGRGLPIGALTSQYLGNLYLDAFDHWVLGHARPAGYVRYMDDMLLFGPLSALGELRVRAIHRLALMGLRAKNGGVLNRCALGVPWLGFTLYPNRTRLDPRGRRRLRRRLRAAERAWERGELDDLALQARVDALFAHARRADDVAWRRAILATSSERTARGSVGEAQERRESSGPGRLLEQHRQEVPLRVPQQEEPVEPQQEPGLPGRPAPRHGGAETPPDDAPSRARTASCGRDESSGRTPVGAEIQTGRDRTGLVPEEKAPAGAPPNSGDAL